MALPTLSIKQEGAVKASSSWFRNDNTEPFTLSGYAGTGKSTILPVIIDNLGLDPENVAFCAPTGKAAKVMASKLAQYDIKTRCRTIHSYIYTPKMEKPAVIEKRLTDLKNQLDYLISNPHQYPDETAFKKREHELTSQITQTEKELDKALDRVEHPGFLINLESEVRSKSLIVVDEASMVGTKIYQDLSGFGIPILAMGDPGQLKPIEDTPGFDLEDPSWFLDEIHRQAQDNPIIRLSAMAREGKNLPYGDYGDGVKVITRRQDQYTTNPDLDAQIIVGTHVKRWNVTKAVRKAYGYTEKSPQAGEVLIVCKNSKNIPELVNGSFVRCVDDVKELENGDAYFPIKTEDENGVVRTVLAFQGLFEEHFLRQKNATTASKRDAFKARIEKEHLDWG